MARAGAGEGPRRGKAARVAYAAREVDSGKPGRRNGERRRGLQGGRSM